MSPPRVQLFQRLPEIYRIRDAEQTPPRQLEQYLEVVEAAFGTVHENIEALYNDLFIETCDDWVVPYLADLVGTSHLKGDPRTLRADVADTVALRRRKGTLSAIELLAFDLTEWTAHCVELRENLGWNQHLNHQRPDEGGAAPYGLPSVDRFTVRRGGTMSIRSPAMLSLLGTPFDPFAHVADVKSANDGAVHYNLPNLAIFLWRLKDYRIPLNRPLGKGFAQLSSGPSLFAVRFDLHPLDRPVRLFNTYRFDENQRPPLLSHLDEVPGPIPSARLNSDPPAGNPDAYQTIDLYDPTNFTVDDFDVGETGLQFYLPTPQFSAGWKLHVRGDNLCAWETGLRAPLREREIVIDPRIGRVLFGVGTAAERDALLNDLWVGYTYGTAGPVGAHPTSRAAVTATSGVNWVTSLPLPPTSPGMTLFSTLGSALGALAGANPPDPIIIEIHDSLVHDLDLSTVAGIFTDTNGDLNLLPATSLTIRAAGGQRPILRLEQPLRFQTKNPGAPFAIQAKQMVRLEGLYLTRGPAFPVGEPLIARAAIGRLELIGCTLDPGGFRKRDGARAALHPSIRLERSYGFSGSTPFAAIPHILLQRTISGAVLIDPGYRLVLSDSILDAGAGVTDPPGNLFALAAASANPLTDWGAPTDVRGATFFGRTRVEQMSGTGGIWVHPLEVHDNQKGCIKFSYFSGKNDRLPPHFACVSGPEAELRFTSEWFEQPGYGQLGLTTNKSILQLGPRYPNQREEDSFAPSVSAVSDEMGAFGFLLESHKWINLQTRFREFMPIGVRPLLIPVT
jgi:Phage tail protein (Tail_P2_I)